MSKRLILLFLPLFIFLGIWAFLYQPCFSILNLDQLQTATFTDKVRDKGESEIIKFQEDKNFKALSFELKNEFISPYAGMSFFQDGKYWDLSPYDEVEIEVELQNTKNLELTLATYQNGITKEPELLTFRHNVMEIPVQENITVCRLSLNQVQVAQWWLEKFKLRSTELGPVDWKKTSSLSFVAKIRLDNNKPQLLKIYKVVFLQNLTLFYFSSVIFLLFTYIGIGYYLKNLKSKITDIPKKLELLTVQNNENINEEEKTILNYLGENYASPDLTLGKMSDILRYPEKNNFWYSQEEFFHVFQRISE